MTISPELSGLLKVVNKNFPPTGLPRDDPLAGIEACIVYTRLSKEDRTRGSHSPETQLYFCRQTANGQGWRVVKEFTEDADHPISGKAFEGRPGWEQLVAYVQSMPLAQRRKTCVLVLSVDRFSRNLEEGIATERRFREELKVRLRAADDLYSAPETLQGGLIFAFKLLMSQMYRLDIQLKTERGLATARRKGRHLGKHPQHFNKRKVGERKQDWILVPDETAMLVARLRAEGLSYVEIGKETGLTRHQAYDICEFLAREKERLEVG